MITRYGKFLKLERREQYTALSWSGMIGVSCTSIWYDTGTHWYIRLERHHNRWNNLLEVGLHWFRVCVSWKRRGRDNWI